MKASLLLAGFAVASGREAPGALQQLVEAVFERYLPSEKTAVCKRMVHDCELFTERQTEIKACFDDCAASDLEHATKLQCYMKCPHNEPTTVQELALFGKHMACSKACGKDRACHEACADAIAFPHGGCPFSRKQKSCRNLMEAVECHKRGGNHTACAMDKDAVEFLLAEPWSLVKDVSNHAVDFILPPAPLGATQEEVHSCHKSCGYDGACHRACPTGKWGVLQQQCETLDAQKACHKDCKSQELECPFKKMSCHMKCPKSMPESIEEFKATVEHMACHADCGKDKPCHESCPTARQWTERKEKCAEYKLVSACHKGCHGQGFGCHAQCPHAALPDKASAAGSPGSLVKEVVGSLLI